MKTQKKMDAVSDVYSDEVNDVYIKTEVREIPKLQGRTYILKWNIFWKKNEFKKVFAETVLSFL